jgi:hypothetical protein
MTVGWLEVAVMWPSLALCPSSGLLLVRAGTAKATFTAGAAVASEASGNVAAALVEDSTAATFLFS